MLQRRRLLVAAALCATVWALTSVASAQAVTELFEYTGGEQEFEVPAGVTSIEVAAIGGKGGDAPLTGGGATQGGDAAEVIGTLSVTPGQILYIEVGGNGGDSDTTAEGGFNGGGNGGGGGGGASDVRTSPRSVDLETEDTRLIVAAGGGGAGDEGPQESGGVGGDAGQPGGGTIYSGGGAGTQTEGGGGAEGCFNSGGSGQLGLGGDGSYAGAESGPAGGGGGGLYGGGGGAGSCEFGSSGGGGGSSLVPPGGEEFLAPEEEPLIEIIFTPPSPPSPPTPPAPTVTPPPATAPETVLGSHPKKTVKTKTKRAKVRFAFSSPTAGATFQCKIDKGAYAGCKSPKSYKLKVGKHTFSVVASSGGVKDPTPATFKFKVKKKK
jgi:hypothetical protein